MAAVGLADHDLGRVEPTPIPGSLGWPGRRWPPRPAAEFDDPVGRLEVEQLDRPAGMGHLRGTPAMIQPARWPRALVGWWNWASPVRGPPLQDAAQHRLCAPHEGSPSTSRSLEVKACSRAPPWLRRARRGGCPLASCPNIAACPPGRCRALANLAWWGRWLGWPDDGAMPSAVSDVGVIVLFGEIGCSLAEIGRFLAGERQRRRELIEHKLADLATQQPRIEVTRTTLEHGRHCPASEPLQCSRFWSIIDQRQHGRSLEESHARVHRPTPPPGTPRSFDSATYP